MSGCRRQNLPPSGRWLAFIVVALLCSARVETICGRGLPGSTSARPTSQFSGLARVFRALSQGGGGEAAAGRLFDFEQVLIAVIGRADVAGHSLDEYRAAFAGTRTLILPADRGALARDETAYRLHSLGYSAREIADVLTGRISKTALDNAQKMLMVGQASARVSDYLDREYRRFARARDRGWRENRVTAVGPADVEALIAKYAARHGVERSLARAVAATESGWNQAARSRAGAVGVMQLMPGTARELGVEPADLEQNIEGGLRYLGWLLQTFGSVERALIGYNAGPGFAQRFVRGEVTLYGETREFVRRVLEARGPA